ncbi:MAG: DUF2169 domain-containing protein [Enhygromyxa sp.]
MKVIKPGKLGVLTRCFEHGRRFYMGVSVLAFVPLGELEALLSEVEMWKFTATRLGAEGALDVAIPKSRGEFLVNGKAYAPGGVPQPMFPVRAQVGELCKDAYVFGDRFWTGSSATEPRPITEMPLDWAHAYGGPDFAKNPLGKGEAEVTIEGVEIRPLPNLESPRELIDSPRRRPEPLGFGPIDISWPQRTSLAGTHDQHWLEHLFPGFARDVDWGIHNIAQPDQQREGFWQGGEPYRFDNMHPSKVVTGVLPRLRARVLVSRSHAIGEPRPSFSDAKQAAKQAPAQLEEVPLALQTLWFFPDAERAVLIWQGSITVAEEDGADVVHLLVAAEHHDRPKPLEHYQAALAARLDPEWGALAAMREEELLPEELADPPDQAPSEDEQLSAVEGLAQQNLHRRMTEESQKARDIVASYGLDPDLHGPALPEPLPPAPKLQELPDLIAKVQAEAKVKQAELEAIAATKQAEAERDADEAKIPGFDGKALREEIDAKQIGPPQFTAAAQHAALVKMAMDCRAQDMIVDEIEEMIVDKQLYAQWEEAEHNMREGYRLIAHHQHPAPAMPSELLEPTRARVRQAIEQGEDFSTLNFTGADLRGMDLRGADLTGALLESADLSGADLSGAKLGRAVLAHATLTDTRFDRATLEGANLGKARLLRTSFAGADLRKVILTETLLEGVILQGAQVGEAMVMGARLVEVDGRELIGEGLNLLELTIERSDLRGAKLSRTNFIKTDLRGAVFDQATLASCTFLACNGAAVRFVGADLQNARFVEGCTLDGADLSEARMIGANLRGTSLRAANLRKAVLDGADLSECDLAEAKLYQVVARGARFEVSDLREAELISANLMGASFARATIYGADLRGANLHGADMARVRSDNRVQLGDALLTKVRIHPRHVEPGEAEEGTRR